MRRFTLVLVGAGLLLPLTARADLFDYYTNDVLVKVPKSDRAVLVKALTEEMLLDHVKVIPGIKPALIVVKTNDGRLAKVLVQAARQKLADKKQMPILYIDRFVTYKDGDEKTIVAEGKNIRLFPDFHFNLDLGQVVPAVVGGDLRLVVEGEKIFVEPLGKAEIYLVKKHFDEANPKKGGKIIVGAMFEPKYFNGVFQLYDDGRRSGQLHLKVDDDGDVNGAYYSDKDGTKYDVTGRIGDPLYTIKFKVQLPQISQEYVGWMFTGDAKAITGFSRLQERETAFYAVRVEKD